VGFCGIFEHFPRFEFSLLPKRIHARPHAGNANRSAGYIFIFASRLSIIAFSSASKLSRARKTRPL